MLSTRMYSTNANHSIISHLLIPFGLLSDFVHEPHHHKLPESYQFHFGALAVQRILEQWAVTFGI